MVKKDYYTCCMYGKTRPFKEHKLWLASLSSTLIWPWRILFPVCSVQLSSILPCSLSNGKNKAFALSLATVCFLPSSSSSYLTVPPSQQHMHLLTVAPSGSWLCTRCSLPYGHLHAFLLPSFFALTPPAPPSHIPCFPFDLEELHWKG